MRLTKWTGFKIAFDERLWRAPGRGLPALLDVYGFPNCYYLPLEVSFLIVCSFLLVFIDIIMYIRSTQVTYCHAAIITIARASACS